MTEVEESPANHVELTTDLPSSAPEVVEVNTDLAVVGASTAPAVVAVSTAPAVMGILYPLPRRTYPNMLLAEDRLRIAQLTRLIQSVRERDYEMIARLVSKGYPKIIDYVHPESGETAIGLAASLNDAEMISFLLGLGADPNVVGLDGRSGVMRAAEFGHVEAMEVLAAAHADMTLQDEWGKGVLYHSINPGMRHARCAEIAIDHGADVNNVDDMGLPLFVFACETARYNQEICMLLLEKGANPSSLDQETRRTAIMAAAASGNAKLTLAILRKGATTVNQIMNKSEVHACHEAAKGGHMEVLKILAAFGSDMNQQTNRSYTEAMTPIHLAAMEGNAPKSCTFLAQRGCKAKTKNREGYTATQVAKILGNKAASKACRKAEKLDKPKAKKPEPWALRMHDYCYYIDDKLFEKFQEFDPEQTGYVSPSTFIDILAGFEVPLPEDPKVLKKFLEDHTVTKQIDYYAFLGGKKYLKSKFLMIAFEPKFKKEKGSKKKKKPIKPPFPICTAPESLTKSTVVPEHVMYTDWARFGPDRPPLNPVEDDSAWYTDRPERNVMTLNAAVRRRDFETLVRALEKNPEMITMIDELYKTPLAVAAGMGDIELVQLLLDAGADLKKKDNFFWTPLHHACHAGLENVAELLLSAGAAKNVKTMNGATPLVRAAESNSAGIVKMLVGRKANIRTENRCEKVPLQIAAEFSEFEAFNAINEREMKLPEDKNKKKKRPAAKPKKKEDQKEVKPVYKYTELLPAIRLEQRASFMDHAAYMEPDRKDPPEDITYQPRQTWMKMKSTEELIADRQARRDQYGWTVDFEGFRMPFLQNVENKLAVIYKNDAAQEEVKRHRWKKPKVKGEKKGKKKK